MKKLCEVSAEELFAEYMELGTFREVGEKYGVTRERIRQRLKDYKTRVGHKRKGERMKERNPLNKKLDYIQRRISEGANIEEIAHAIKMCPETLRFFAKSRGIKTPTLSAAKRGRPVPKLRRFDRAEMVRLFKGGMTRYKIAKKMGVTPMAIRCALIYDGLLPKPSWWENRRGCKS